MIRYTSKMAVSSSSIDILFMKFNSNKDDKIRIKKNLNYNEFEITYTENSRMDTPYIFKSSGMYLEKVLDYVYVLIKNQYVDDEPYDTIQFDIPAMPPILVKSEKFKDSYYRDHLFQLVSTGLNMLETTELVRTGLPTLEVPTCAHEVPTVPQTPNNSQVRHAMRPLYSDEPSYNVNSNYYPVPNSRSTPNGVLPQHLYWD